MFNRENSVTAMVAALTDADGSSVSLYIEGQTASIDGTLAYPAAPSSAVNAVLADCLATVTGATSTYTVRADRVIALSVANG